MKKRKNRLYVWWYKQTHFEFFSITKLYTPVVFYAIGQAIVMCDVLWFRYVNPLIYWSGLREHSKYDLLKQLPTNTIKSIFIPSLSTKEFIEEKFKKQPLQFPVVIKPDRLYRGIGISKATTLEEFMELTVNIKHDLLVQEYAQYPTEYAVFYVRYPYDEKGQVVSLIKKEFMNFVGDGKKTLEQIIDEHPRAWLYRKKLDVKFSSQEYQMIPKRDEIISAGFVGSHNKGTVFLDCVSEITPQLSHTFDKLTKNIPEFYYGRYDVKSTSIDALAKGEFEILELNPAIGEPVHMYDPQTTIVDGYKIILSFWKKMTTIARQNKQRGIIPVKKPE